MTEKPRRGDIFLIDLDPVKGSDQGELRPVVVIQNNTGNEFSPVIIVAAITSKIKKLFDIHVLVSPPEGNLEKESVILLNQIRTIDKTRLIRKTGSLSENVMTQVNITLEISLGLHETV